MCEKTKQSSSDNGDNVGKKEHLWLKLLATSIFIAFSSMVSASPLDSDNVVFNKLFKNRQVEIKGCNIKISRPEDRAWWQANFGNLFLAIFPSPSDSYFACDGSKTSTESNTPFKAMGSPCGEWFHPQYGKEPIDYMDTDGPISLTKSEIDLIERKLSACSKKKNKTFIVHVSPKMSSLTSSSGTSSRSGNFNMYPDNPKRTAHSTQWTAGCKEGGTAGAWVQDDSPSTYCWSGYGFAGSKTGCESNLGVEAAMRKACSGE